jgi:hypothetical protein
MKSRSDRGSGWLPIGAIVLVALILIDIIWPRKDQP